MRLLSKAGVGRLQTGVFFVLLHSSCLQVLNNKIINHVSSLLLFHEIIQGNFIDSFATIPPVANRKDVPISVFCKGSRNCRLQQNE